MTDELYQGDGYGENCCDEADCQGSGWWWADGDKVICGKCLGTGFKLTPIGKQVVEIVERLIRLHGSK